MPKSKIQSPKSKNEETETLRNQLARALADYDNLQKRVDRERADVSQLVSLGLILKLLTVLDNLEAAQKHLGDQGLAIAINEFKRVLNEEGLEEIKPGEGEEFDHNTQEVIESVEGGKNGKIAGLVLPGWRYNNEKVVRPAKVKVFGGNTHG